MKISFAICTHNEGSYIVELLKQLTEWIRSPVVQNDIHEYEIIIVDDYSTNAETLTAFESFGNQLVYPYVNIYKHALNNNFAAHKNFLNSKCTGDWIFNLDGDETVSYALLDALTLIVEHNPLVEAYWLPRINTVDGLTFKHIQRWGWIVTKMDGYRKVKYIDPVSDEYLMLKSFGFMINDENGVVTYDQPIINFPDLQMRFYRNDFKIKWEGVVHEKLRGFTNFSILPQSPEYAIQHHKDIARQEKQNAFYDKLM